MDYDMTNPYEIAKYIKEAKKATPVKVYVKGDLSGVSAEDVKVFGQGDFWILMGDHAAVQALLDSKKTPSLTALWNMTEETPLFPCWTSLA